MAWTAFDRAYQKVHRVAGGEEPCGVRSHRPFYPLDDLERQAVPVGELIPDQQGAVLPRNLRWNLSDSQREAREEAAVRREEADGHPMPLPAPRLAHGALRCTVCQRSLAPELAAAGRHLLR
ncbi:hypothetical protein DEJ51_31215 [Streptomyces venezuelae]|uniref:Uncharacterized protein n=1 Tax=Streptomyces venezuelae TaxID=54571 RepID=A0A5P2DSM5_STRVZ|nr:hypothetical protein [Streptomyces venezuelae]QES58066.1 hypothetical protein DEJ51_31215 [Streptomyces venezuelae]